MYRDYRKRRRIKMILMVVLSAVVIVTGLAGWLVRRSYMQAITPLDATNQNSNVVTIKSGSSVHEVAVELESKRLIKKAWAFEWYVRSSGSRDKLQAGSYIFKPSMSVADIVKVVTEGRVATDLFTILPAQRLDQIESAFIKAGYSKTAVQAAFEPNQYVDHPALTDKPKEASLEGYLYPDSFQKTAETTPETIIRASLDEMAKALTPEVRASITKQGLTVHQGVILASIVEKEVSNNVDRAKVAQVFYKRLKQNMQLGSDVTAYYGAEISGLPRSVTTDTAYNTRLHNGLPPGPIGNVSRSSLQAVAAPASTDFLYFVTGDDGTTYYSNTQKEHEDQTAQYCKKLCQE